MTATVASSSASSHGVAYGNPFWAAVKQSLAALNASARLFAIHRTEVLLLDRTEIREEAGHRARAGMIGLWTRRAVDGLQLTGHEHVRQRSALGGRVHAGRQRLVHRRRPRRVDVADPPLDRGGIQTDEAQEVAVPDRAARRVAVHADAFAGQIRGLPDGAALPDIQVARREVAQGKHGEADVAAVALVDAVEVLRHRPLPALHPWVLHGATGISARAGHEPRLPKIIVTGSPNDLLLESVRDPTSRQIVGRQLNRDSV